ncbi:MAG: ABC transporter ATP-binding protein [Verrucomicrobia bacterium]|nr:ABC transporter ATP-binding protein [Verrucomicrobiota bacterium]MCH8514258.1 ABC transporter ATP-binding protein [Kiritimatiellia bacterium]
MTASADASLLLRVHGARVLLGRNGQGGNVVARLPDLEMTPGERVALTGPSGCGKSTFLNVVSGLRALDEGVVQVDGTDLGKLKPAALDVFRGRNIGFVHQTFHLLHGFSVLDNVMAGLRFGRVVPAGQRKSRALEILEEVGLGHRLRAYPQKLSVGERQRVAIARALAGHPKLLLADEPTGALDPVAGGKAVELMENLCAKLNCGWLCVTHDQALAARFPRRISCADAIGNEVGSESREVAS